MQTCCGDKVLDTVRLLSAFSTLSTQLAEREELQMDRIHPWIE